jgi:hypothetical protein
MKKHILAAVLAWVTFASAAAEDAPSVIFERKYFTDFGNFVGVEGSLTREGASPKDPTRSVLWCYKERRECLGFNLVAIGTMVSIRPAVPIIYTVTVWAPDRIVAEFNLACGDRETWLLDRLRRTAEVFGGSCGGNARGNHATLEDPPSWTKLKERIEELKRRR